MSSSVNNLFGPLGREYCVWFYYLSVLGFILLVLFLVGGLYVALTKRVSTAYFVAMLPPALAYAIFYFQNRLLYSMCARGI